MRAPHTNTPILAAVRPEVFVLWDSKQVTGRFGPSGKFLTLFFFLSLGTHVNIEESIFVCLLLAGPKNKIKPYIFFRFVYDVDIQYDAFQEIKCILKLWNVEWSRE